MNRFTEWLEKEAYGKQIFYCIIGTVILNFFLEFFNISLLIIFQVDLSGLSKNAVQAKDVSSAIFLPMIIGVALEEIKFRLLPLFFAKELGFSKNEILIVALLISSYFGYIHGIVYNIILQGVAGFLFSLLFLKCGGLQSHYWKACFVSSSAHYLNNAILCTIILLQ